MNDNFFGKLFGNSDDNKNNADQKPRSPQPASKPTLRPATPPVSAPVRPQRPATPPARPASPPVTKAPAKSTGIPMNPKPAPARPAPPPSRQPARPPASRPGSTQPPARSPRPSAGATSPASSDKDGEYSIDDLLKLIVEKSGSDLHLTVGSPPMLRLQGKLWPTDLPILTPKESRRLIYQFLDNEQREKLEENLELDMSYELSDVARYRCNVFFTRLGMGAVFRVIPTEIKSLEELRMPPILGDLARRNKGLILVTGPTGSGKSTTLAAMVDQVNRERQDHILTIEDPIEFVHKHQTCIVNQREIGPNTKSFSNALKSALREDPDIILVGEMRDYETISLAVTAAETGHLVFATLHTPSAAQSVDRIVDVSPLTNKTKSELS